MTDTKNELIPRGQFLTELGISDSNERRQRKEGHPWPPHLRIGNKVYYRRSAVEDYLRAQEALCQTQPLANERSRPPQALTPEIEGQVDHRVSLDAVGSDTVG
jgi:hypothetical protein